MFSYVQLVLPHHLESLFRALGVYLDRDHTYTIRKHDLNNEISREAYQAQVRN